MVTPPIGYTTSKMSLCHYLGLTPGRSRNQLVTDPNGGAIYYDNNGNRTQDNGAYNRFFTYDPENQLISVEFQYASYRTDFTYDGRGRLRRRIDYTWNGTSWGQSDEVRYLYDGMRVMQERNSSNIPTVSYTRGSDLSGTVEGAGGIGGLLARSHGYSTGTGAWSTHNFYHADGNGNITMLVDSTQTSSAVYRYDPFGNTISSSGTLAAANKYRFSSKELMTSSGLYYYGYRFYDPNNQRWLNRDPLQEKGGLNLYGFVGNNSVNYVDQTGLAYGNPVPPCALYPSCLDRPKPPPSGCACGKGECIVRANGLFETCMEYGSAACAVGCIVTWAGYAACLASCEASVLAGCTASLAINVARCLFGCGGP